MDLGLQRRTCLVSGSSSGIGRAVAFLLAEEGARVLLTARSKAALAPAAEEIPAAGASNLPCSKSTLQRKKHRSAFHFEGGISIIVAAINPYSRRIN